MIQRPTSWRSPLVLLSGDTEANARERHKHYLQLALSSVTQGPYFFWARPPLATDQALWSLDSSPSPIPLKRRTGDPIYLTVTQSLRMKKHKREWRMSTQQYIYNVADVEDAHQYLFAWHWHPPLGRPECHLHARAALVDGTNLDGKHLPSSRVTLEDVLRFLVSEWDVEPVSVDWAQILEETQRTHERYKSWWGARKH
jgi:hypothetical protein